MNQFPCRRLLQRSVETLLILLVVSARPAEGYIDIPPATLGRMCEATMSITVVRVEKIEEEKGLVIFRAIRDLKGNGPSDLVRHAVGTDLGRGDAIIRWAKPGKQAIHFASASRNYSYTYIDGRWYACALVEGWWRLVRIEPNLLHCYCGAVNRLVKAVEEILAAKEVVVPVLDAGSKERQIPASLKLIKSPKQDFGK
jgi:hypothetical protein